MFKAKIKQEHRILLLELLKIMAEVDGKVSEEEMEMILEIKKMYRMKDYEYQNMSKEDIRNELSNLDDETVLNILTHALLLALGDKDFDDKERALFAEYFDLLSLESATKLQQFVNKYGKEELDIRDLYEVKQIETEAIDESLELVQEFSNNSVEDVDETMLMKMKKGPLKKVWDKVLFINEVIRDPKYDKKLRALGIGALLYVLLPTDTIPDIIPILGLTDDVAVVSFAIAQFSKGKNVNWKMLIKK